MILRGVAFALLLVSVLLVQTVVAPAARVAGVVPDLVVLSVLSVGMIRGPGAGLRYGFAAGIAVDLLSGPDSIVGVTALLLLLAGYGAGMVRPFIAASQLPGQMLVGGLGVPVVVLLAELFDLLLGGEVAAPVALLTAAVVSGAYAALLAPLMGLLVARLERALPEPG